MSARAYAQRLLADLDCADLALALPKCGASAARRCAESGLLALTGPAGGPPVMPTVALPFAADGALGALRALAPPGAFAALAGGAELLSERAALAGLIRRGRVSAGGACRLLPARDRWLAVSLPRADDARSLAAWLEDDSLAGATFVDEATWEKVALRLAAHPAEEWVARARWLGLAVAKAEPAAPSRKPWLEISRRSERVDRNSSDAPLVIDLSSLWAGPLAGRLLRLAGARVIKVESSRRPDGARFGPAAFFDLLNAGKQSVALDLAGPDGCSALRRLLARADVVIESSRARALRQLGIDAEAWVAERPGRVWLSITGYGRSDEGVAFGDDAAAAAGLCWCVAAGAPLFVGDAIADPLAGIHGALAAYAHWRRGLGALLDVSMAGVVGHAIEASGELCVGGCDASAPAKPPPLPAPAPPAQPLGADTARVLKDLEHVLASS